MVGASSPLTIPPPPPARRVTVPRGFHSGQDWLDSLGGIPLDRIIFDPWPGTATEADLLAFCEGEPKRLCELIDGTLVEKPVGLHEGNVGATLIGELFIWNRMNGDRFVLSGADSTLRMATFSRIRLPDVCAFSRDRLPEGKLPPEKVPAIAPDLAVEVLSESNTPAEMRQKLVEYFDNGTRLAWIIDPDSRTVAVHHDSTGDAAETLFESDTLTGGDVLPGFELPVATLFKDLPAEG